jgi:hypothetical protein
MADFDWNAMLKCRYRKETIVISQVEYTKSLNNIIKTRQLILGKPT